MVSFFFFKQKTAYEMRISDWSSDVCSSDLRPLIWRPRMLSAALIERCGLAHLGPCAAKAVACLPVIVFEDIPMNRRSEEHTSELQSLMRISYAVFCLKKKKTQTITTRIRTIENNKHTNRYKIKNKNK